VRRREFIAGLGSAAAWSIAADAQQSDKTRRVGVLISAEDGDPDVNRWVAALSDTLRELGWVRGQNLQIDVRVAGNLEQTERRAKELIELKPDIMVTQLTPGTNAVRLASRNLPIVFVYVGDPIAVGFVQSFARPGGYITGFTAPERTFGGKWVELIHEIASGVTRIAMLFDPKTANSGASGGVYLDSGKSAARALNVEFVVAAASDPSEIDASFAALPPTSGVMVMPNAFLLANQDRIIARAAQYRMPTIYPVASFVRDGGLMSYGVDTSDLFRRSGGYVSRILMGEKPADLPVQLPTKFELAINLKTARILGLFVPQALLVTATELIE
jgi:putative tryptophan/tyrosine transport system substrate-binding protein